jgi:hypothetical protein
MKEHCRTAVKTLSTCQPTIASHSKVGQVHGVQLFGLRDNETQEMQPTVLVTILSLAVTTTAWEHGA